VKTIAEQAEDRWNSMSEDDFLAEVKYYLDRQEQNGTNQLAFGRAYIKRLYNIAQGKKMDDKTILRTTSPIA
jgi:hypothetical protein